MEDHRIHPRALDQERSRRRARVRLICTPAHTCTRDPASDDSRPPKVARSLFMTAGACRSTSAFAGHGGRERAHTHTCDAKLGRQPRPSSCRLQSASSRLVSNASTERLPGRLGRGIVIDGAHVRPWNRWAARKATPRMQVVNRSTPDLPARRRSSFDQSARRSRTQSLIRAVSLAVSQQQACLLDAALVALPRATPRRRSAGSDPATPASCPLAPRPRVSPPPCPRSRARRPPTPPSKQRGEQRGEPGRSDAHEREANGVLEHASAAQTRRAASKPLERGSW